MRAHGVHFILDIPVGTRVFVKASAWPGFVLRSTQQPWVAYRVGRLSGESPGWTVSSTDITGTLPADDRLETVERWLGALD